MKTKVIQIRCTKEFLKMVEYLKQINNFANISDTIRRIIEKEYRKETDECNG